MKTRQKDYGIFINKKWKPIYTAIIYREACLGRSFENIAKGMGVTEQIALTWKMDKNTDVALAYQLGKKFFQKRNNIDAAIIAGLGKTSKKIWEGIKNGGKALLAGQSKRIKQKLFIAALVSNAYSKTRACSMIGIGFSEFKQWMEQDAFFIELFNSAIESQKDFFEESFVDLVKEGSESATIHAARTKLSERGYGNSMKVEYSGNVSVNHNFVGANRILEFIPSDKKAIFLELLLDAIKLSGSQTEEDMTKPKLANKVIDV